MYYNVFGEKVSRARWKEMENAAKNRRELIAAGFNRRDLFKMGLLTSAGYLVAKRGLSARWGSLVPEMQAASPPVTPFVQAMPMMPVKSEANNLNPAPTVAPNTAAGEARTRNHQALTLFPPQKFYKLTALAKQVSVSPSLPAQTLWTYDGFSPGQRLFRPMASLFSCVISISCRPQARMGALGSRRQPGTFIMATHLRRATVFPATFFQARTPVPCTGMTNTIRCSTQAYSRLIRAPATSTKR